MVRLRLQRTGRPHTPHYRLIAVHHTKARDAAGIEVLGHYHPEARSERLTIKADRIKFWLARGARPSETVSSILKKGGVLKDAAPSA